MLSPLGIEVLTQEQLGISEAEEPHCTFIENALAKARHVSKASGLPALADDSGICVAALDGAPGVYSARYAGDSPKSDTRNNEKLLQTMQGVADRRAHYYCVLVLVHHADDPQPLIAEGEWHGEIAEQEQDAATPQEINAAWKRLMGRAHPDQGGTEGLASRLNAARDRLLKR